MGGGGSRGCLLQVSGGQKSSTVRRAAGRKRAVERAVDKPAVVHPGEAARAGLPALFVEAAGRRYHPLYVRLPPVADRAAHTAHRHGMPRKQNACYGTET